MDDDPSIRLLVQHGLKRHFDLTICSNGLEALEWFQEGNQLDIIVTDLNMPSLTGQDLIKRIRSSARGQHIPIIVVSGATESTVRATCRELGANEFISKPFLMKELLMRINDHLHSVDQAP
ncbi:response regulator [Spirosoma pulveris]